MKNGESCSKLDVQRKMDIVRVCAAGNLSTKEALHYINNSGVLGTTYNKKTNKEEPNTMKERTYYKYLAKVGDVSQIQQEFFEFMRERYIVEIRNVLALLSELQSMSIKNLMSTEDTVKRQKIIDSIIRNLPAYTQYMDMLKGMLERGKLPTGEPIPLAEKKPIGETSAKQLDQTS